MVADSHTPGPWAGCRSGILRGSRWVVSNTPDDDGAIMSEADARLIAAAPCLLDALRNLLRETDPITVGCPGIQRAREAARAAIAKAEGVSGG